MGHETPRNSATTGEATPTSDSVVESRETSVGRGACLKRLQELGLPVVRDVQKERTHRASPPPDPRPSAQVVQDPEATARQASFGGPPNFWPSYRSVDLEADRPVDREAISHFVPPQPCLAVTSRHGVELPEARTPSSPTRRSGHCPLETISLAPYKKTLNVLAPIWSSSMNPVSCLSPTWPAPGPQKGKRPSFAISTNKIESRRSAPWPCPPSGDNWPSILIFAPAILRGWMSEPSSNTCSGIFGGPWSCCGIGERSIAAAKSSSGSETIQDCMWNRSLPMPRNSILRNMSGTRPTAPWPIVRQQTCSNLTECSETRSDESGDRRSSSGPVSTLPICPGQDEYFHYLCKTQ